jgi:TatD DNase family protein
MTAECNTTAPLYDAHNHLHAPELSPYLDSVIEQCVALGVRGMVINGTRAADWDRVTHLSELARAQAWPIAIYPAFGYHPWYLSDRPSDWYQHLTHQLDHHSAPTAACASVGEIGLDFTRSHTNHQEQEEIFLQQLSLAAARNVPATIHCVGAWGRMLELLESSPLPQCGVLLHSFNGPPELIARLSACGAYFSLSGSCLRMSSTQLARILATVPLHRLLIETDAPAQPLPLANDPFKLQDPASGARRNHPANLPTVYAAICETLGHCPRANTSTTLSEAELVRVIAANFSALFERRSPVTG